MANVQYRGTGRRKSSVARVILTPGTGNFVINGKEAREYLLSAGFKHYTVFENQEAKFLKL